MLIINSPIEQFTVFPVFQLSNISFYLILILISGIYLIEWNKFLFQKHLEWWVPNFNNIMNNIFIILTIWFLILFSNIIGMIPYSNTVTAQAIIVLSIAIPTFISINLIGLKLHNINLSYLFLPAGVPSFLIPFITILEFISYFVRAISLTLRLAANMIAGHILLKIILYSIINMPLLSLLSLPIVFLELLVAFLQGYVFIVLVCSYYQDVFLPH